MTAAGWYPDPASDRVIRYWDGARWTEERVWDGTAWVAPPHDAAPEPGPEVLPPPPASATGPVATAAAVAPPPIVSTSPEPAGAGSPGWRTAAIVLAGVVAAGVSFGITALVIRSGDSGGTTEVAPVTAGAPSADAPTTAPPSATAPITAPPAAPAAVTGRVVRTCGRNGDGDCFLAVRDSPSGGREIRRLNEGDAIAVQCQVPGRSAYSSSLDASSSAWSRTSDGLYAASIYIDAPGFDPLRVSVACP
jgi:hypothetical protein